MTQRHAILLLLALGLTLSAAGFILQYGFGVIPCQMCWWQRYAHWAIAALAALGLAAQATRRSPALPLTGIIVAAATGLAIAAWQFAAQHGWLPFPPTCVTDPNAILAPAEDLLTAMNQVKIVPCDQENFKLIGLSLAGWNIPASLAAIALSACALPRRP